MANKLNIGLSTYNQYENGGRNIPKDVAISIAKLLDVNIKDIFYHLGSRYVKNIKSKVVTYSQDKLGGNQNRYII